jgi:hypothetical protein
MEHAKKLMLVDPSFLRPTLKEKTFVGLDASIQSILNSDVPDDMKAAQYMHALNRYKTLDRADQTSVDKQKAAAERTESNILDSVSINDRHKAKLLVNYMKRNKDMKLNDQGQLEYQQRPISGSNIIELVTDILNSKSDETPEGWEEFAEGVTEAGAPRRLIVSSKSQRHLRKKNRKPPASSSSPPSALRIIRSGKKQKRQGKNIGALNGSWLSY